jgi:hypothetical protein
MILLFSFNLRKSHIFSLHPTSHHIISHHYKQRAFQIASRSELPEVDVAFTPNPSCAINYTRAQDPSWITEVKKTFCLWFRVIFRFLFRVNSASYLASYSALPSNLLPASYSALFILSFVIYDSSVIWQRFHRYCVAIPQRMCGFCVKITQWRCSDGEAIVHRLQSDFPAIARWLHSDA